jgi:hypothetical protein
LPSFQNSVIWSGKYHADQHPVLQVNTLSSHALNSDWGMWLEQMQTLDQTLFAPVLAELQSGKWHSVTVLISDSASCARLPVKKCLAGNSGSADRWSLYSEPQNDDDCQPALF